MTFRAIAVPSSFLAPPRRLFAKMSSFNLTFLSRDVTSWDVIILWNKYIFIKSNTVNQTKATYLQAIQNIWHGTGGTCHDGVLTTASMQWLQGDLKIKLLIFAILKGITMEAPRRGSAPRVCQLIQLVSQCPTLMVTMVFSVYSINNKRN